MMDSSIGVAVIGAGMAGRTHAAGYRSVSTVYGPGLPPVRLVAIADLNEDFAADTARRFGYERAETDWHAIVQDLSMDAGQRRRREPAASRDRRGAAGCRQTCPLRETIRPSVADAEAMVAAADAAPQVAAVGSTFRRLSAINAMRQHQDRELHQMEGFRSAINTLLEAAKKTKRQSGG
jgi:predicted dehydrogenase